MSEISYTLSQTINSSIIINLKKHNYISFYLTIPTSATISFQSSIDNINYSSISFYNNDINEYTNNTTISGNFSLNTDIIFIKLLTSVGGSADGDIKGFIKTINNNLDIINQNKYNSLFDPTNIFKSSNSINIFDSKFYLEEQSHLFDVSSNGTTSDTIVNNTRRLAVSSTNGSLYVKSFNHMINKIGSSLNIFISFLPNLSLGSGNSIIKQVGLFALQFISSSDYGVSFSLETTPSTTIAYFNHHYGISTDKVSQSNWNINTLSILDFTNIQTINFKFSRGTDILCSFIINNKIIPCHIFKCNNFLNSHFGVVYNLPISYYIKNNNGSASAAVMNILSSAVYLENNSIYNTIPYIETIGTDDINVNADRTLLFAFRYRTTSPGINLIIDKIQTELSTTSTRAAVIIGINPTFSSPVTWLSDLDYIEHANGNGSIIVTSLTICAQYFISTGNSAQGTKNESISLNNVYPIGWNANLTSQILVVIANSLTGSSSFNIRASMNYSLQF